MGTAIPVTGIPFPRSEHERPQQKMLEAMARVDLSALLGANGDALRSLTGCQGHRDFASFPSVLGLGRTLAYVAKVVTAGHRAIEWSGRQHAHGAGYRAGIN